MHLNVRPPVDNATSTARDRLIDAIAPREERRDAIAAPRPPQCALGVLGRHDELPPPPPSAPAEAVALDMPYGSEASAPAPPEQSDGQPLPIVPDLPPPDAEIPAYLRRARGEDI